MNWVQIVGLLALAQYFYFGALVGRARGKYGVKAPATSGHPQFERAYRVQMNTLEQLVAFLPALFLAGLYWPQWAIAGIGAVFLVGRFLYQFAYLRDPSTRGLGFALSMIPTLALLAAAAVGALGLRGD